MSTLDVLAVDDIADVKFKVRTPVEGKNVVVRTEHICNTLNLFYGKLAAEKYQPKNSFLKTTLNV